MKITINKTVNNSYTIKHYHKSGWLAAELEAADEMNLFKLLAGILGVEFIERYHSLTDDKSLSL